MEMAQKDTLDRPWEEQDFNYKSFSINLLMQTLKRMAILGIGLYFMKVIVDHMASD